MRTEAEEKTREAEGYEMTSEELRERIAGILHDAVQDGECVYETTDSILAYLSELGALLPSADPTDAQVERAIDAYNAHGICLMYVAIRAALKAAVGEGGDTP